MSFKNYLRRFTPWTAALWKKRSAKREIFKEIKMPFQEEVRLRQSLIQLLKMIDKTYHCTTKVGTEELQRAVDDVLFKEWGFNLTLKASLITGAGNGVFVSKGSVEKGQMVALYPGTLYFPGEPMLIASFGNQYILRCSDGMLVDGKHTGVSKCIFKSCLNRDRRGALLPGDWNWLTATPLLPISIGQYVNNYSNADQTGINVVTAGKGTAEECCQNVSYEEFNIQMKDMSLPQQSLLPYVFYGGTNFITSEPFIRCVPLVATRRIQCDEELYSSYFTELYTSHEC